MKRDVERRLSERVPCTAPGRIVDDESCITDCKMVDLSAGGARLEVPYGSILKREFRLFVPSRQIERQVEIVWRDSYELGVHFLPEARGNTETAIPAQSEASKLESVNANIRLPGQTTPGQHI